jgi:hypothetical protein
MNQPIYYAKAWVFFVVVFGACFLFLSLFERIRKKQISFGFNFGIALIVAVFLLFVVEVGLR